MPSTLRDLSELTAPEGVDQLLISDTSDVLNRDKKISRLNLVGANITGGGTISTAGHSVSFPAPGIVALKTSASPSVGAAVQWADANTLEGAGYLADVVVRRNGNLVANNVITGYNTEQSKDSGVPIADVGRLSIPQTFTGLRTFPNGINIGNGINNLSIFEAQGFSPKLTFSGGDGGLVHTTTTGTYIRIHNWIICDMDIRLSAIGTASGNARITDLPYATLGNRSIGTVRWTALATAFVSILCQASGSTYLSLAGLTAASTTSATLMTAAHFTNTSTLLVSMAYPCATAAS